MMEGVNYQFMCHHPHASIGFLVKDVASFLFEQKHPALDVDVASSSSSSTNDSTATTQTRPSSWDEFEVEEHANELLHRAMQVLHRANVFSDAPFLFAPGHIAFAIVAIVVESTNEGGFLGDIMQDYLVTRYPMQSEEEILEYTRNVSRVISLLLSNHNMDLRPRQNVSVSEIVAQRAAQLHRVLCRVRKMARQTAASQTATLVESRHRRKRTRSVADADFTPPRGLPVRKMVTPTY
uniref:Uncharacterized protein n=2 Tax=Entomoneis paludosa TaxID=265537 RepID=A0A7S2Y8K3_9STRA|mmetsp:Transcript_22407/g.46716  ORF Transcript_22407/g.46716 Transcript_22407/m.46716 type:complete len:237 (+) Transcript_22407:551-1261(+)|eukprot:CAMPEP_0172467856 /NCGR_PEP_ID=MMETSP1065-20121228/59984_1 /TAXON_ID=265537 /ORGANISM="Amphiprora paludosa, Strain CCMP125" /LENGTH=236 /DNA_ID=CAMNT_0013225115 /DNA_START=120 /DNA_END=830 /DNA_ORIENTATION=+